MVSEHVIHHCVRIVVGVVSEHVVHHCVGIVVGVVSEHVVHHCVRIVVARCGQRTRGPSLCEDCGRCG